MAAPINLTPPVISGTPTVGQTLTLTSNGTWTDDGSPTFTRQWRRDFGSGYSDIALATGTTYVLTDTDDLAVGILCNVTDTDSGGATTAPSNAIGPVVEPPPVARLPATALTRGSITGAFQIGRTVTYTPFNVFTMWDNMVSASAFFTWQFQQSSDGATWTDIAGVSQASATSATFSYLIPPVLRGQRLRVKLIAQNSGGTATAFTIVPFVTIVGTTNWQHYFNFGSRNGAQPDPAMTFGNNLSSVGVDYLDSNSIWTGDDVSNQVKKADQFGNYVLALDDTKTTDCFDVACSPFDGNVYVASNGHMWVARFQPNGTFLNTVGTPGTGPGQFRSPGCIGFFSDGSVLVGEEVGNRIQKFTGALVYQSLFKSGARFFAVAPDDTVWTSSGLHLASDGSLIADWSANATLDRGMCCDNGSPYRIYSPKDGSVIAYDQTLIPIDYIGWPGSTGEPSDPGTSTAPADQFGAVANELWINVKDGRMTVSDRTYNRVSIWLRSSPGGTAVLSPPYDAGQGSC